MAGMWFSPGIPVSSTNKTNCHDITEILLKVVLNTITLTPYRIKTTKPDIYIYIYIYVNMKKSI
jgi:hypothetical protein